MALPLIKKDHWLFRVFDYPRMQKFISVAVVTSLWFLFFKDSPYSIDWIVITLLIISLLYLSYIIFPFTPFSKPMVDKVTASKEPTLNLLVANVYQDNTSYSKLLKVIKNRNPEIIFLVETNNRWLENIKSLRKDYPYHIEIPQENTYGMLFYSKLKIKNHKINYLIDNEIPSVYLEIEFNNQIVKVFGLHPTPPVPPENKHSTDRDAEILMVGKTVKECEGPCLVIGDLNDVAWSYSTKLFLKISGLLDPRRGRGFYNTFNAKYMIMRWPLDHYFISSHFRLVDMAVEEHIDSDHFPISISLMISHKDESDQLQATASEEALVEDKIEAGLKGENI